MATNCLMPLIMSEAVEIEREPLGQLLVLALPGGTELVGEEEETTKGVSRPENNHQVCSTAESNQGQAISDEFGARGFNLQGGVHFKLAFSISSYWGTGFVGGVVVVVVVGG